MTSIKLPPEDAERDRLEELAQKRAEHCWPKDMVRQFETRCDFREGWHAYAEHFARPVRSVKDASAEELMGNPKFSKLVNGLKNIMVKTVMLNENPSNDLIEVTNEISELLYAAFKEGDK